MSHLKSPEEMTPEQLSIALENVAILEVWIKSVREHAFEVLKEGGQIPGWKLGYGSKKRIWRLGTELAALQHIHKATGVAIEDLYTKPEFLTPPAVEKLLKLKDLWPKKKRGQERPPTPIDPFVDYSMPEPRVMRMSAHDDHDDKNRDAASEFGE